jgi:ubiquinone/menaquinone biosynthesis C-methylase UbiE
MSSISFKFMHFILIFRDQFLGPKEILRKIDNIRNGSSVLDYGCGPGSFTTAAAELVGGEGTVYAADIHSLAIQYVQKLASKKGFYNIKTIYTSCDTGLKDSSIDVILLYYVLHDFHNPYEIIRELHRVLKSDGILTIIDHKLSDDEVIALVTNSSSSSSSFKFLKKLDGHILIFINS